MSAISRRQLLISSAAAAVLLPLAVRRYLVSLTPQTTANTDGKPVVWQGIALGSGAEIRIYHTDRAFAESVIQKALTETARLEKIFSLYDENSVLSRLNREGRLKQPTADLLAVLGMSRDIYRLTGGAFDPTIQPLWNTYAGYFRRHPNANTPPPQRDINKALALVGLDKMQFDSSGIAFAEKGMGLSLNGIAQGYITDKVVELLQRHGITQALVDMGEIRGLSANGQKTWQVGIKNPQDESQVLLSVPLQNEGFATSGGYGTVFNEQGTFTHLFDPRTGGAQPRYRSISVMAANAATADALATAFAIMPETAVRQAARSVGAKVWLVMSDGRINNLE
ncbi:FAD:protein FMN transferase [Neisseria perflava]|uniref:FAD:protein FMN transferase n=1 Tax=Neisseria perflava TaxID=33053 RepID=UPI00209D31D9|nr:FAD:protein FMN transferase [Neisseria perflava]MCP1659741.1 thiamine biosynthesis lipoprotein [Neisseria perflava]MCP1771660.1 thiamine biosynthesis lipoprotein [Neisseria perflava]